MTELLDVRVIGTPDVAEQAVTRFAELLDVGRCTGPYPSRKTPALVRFYLSGRLHPIPAEHAAGTPADSEV